MANQQTDRARIAALLRAYGSDVSRWPAHERQLADQLSAEERAEIFRDDKALDKLLQQAGSAADNAPPADAVLARIMGSVDERDVSPTSIGEAENVVAFDPSATRTTLVISPQRERTAAAALLAASLVLGIFIGSMPQLQTTARAVGEFAGVGVNTTVVQTSALDDALQIQDDEDIL